MMKLAKGLTFSTVCGKVGKFRVGFAKSRGCKVCLFNSEGINLLRHTGIRFNECT